MGSDDKFPSLSSSPVRASWQEITPPAPMVCFARQALAILSENEGSIPQTQARATVSLRVAVYTVSLRANSSFSGRKFKLGFDQRPRPLLEESCPAGR